MYRVPSLSPLTPPTRSSQRSQLALVVLREELELGADVARLRAVLDHVVLVPLAVALGRPLLAVAHSVDTHRRAQLLALSAPPATTPTTSAATPPLAPPRPPARATLANIPDEVPDLPASFQPRHELNEALKESVLSSSSAAPASQCG